jgi:hypothetical protein
LLSSAPVAAAQNAVTASPAAVAQDVVDQAAAVTLEFAWPVGLSADVETEHRIVRRDRSQSLDVTVDGHYRMTVREHPRGLAVVQTDGAVTAVRSDPELPRDDSFRLIGSLPVVDATYIISDDGRLLEVEGMERSTAALRDAFAQILAGADTASGPWPFAGPAGASLSAEALRSAAVERWGAMIWFWAWEEFRPDSVYTFTAEVTDPALPSEKVPVRYRVGFLQEVACRADAAPASCVQVEARVRPDPEALARMRERWASAAAEAAGAPSASVTAFDFEILISVILEPSTMVPHEFRTRQATTAETTVDGTSGVDERLDETVTTFLYGSPSIDAEPVDGR